MSAIKRWCETCEGCGHVDETLGGERFSDPKAECPDCDGKGYWIAHLTQPAQSVDVEDVRLLLECVEDEHGGDHLEADCRHCAAFDRLTAALQEKGNG